MRYRGLGSSNLEISEIALGSWLTFSGGVAFEQTRAGTASKRRHHPVVGDLELNYEVMEPSADDGLTMSLYRAQPDSRSQQALDLVAS